MLFRNIIQYLVLDNFQNYYSKFVDNLWTNNFKLDNNIQKKKEVQ